jgi:hypothetical protein
MLCHKNDVKDNLIRGVLYELDPATIKPNGDFDWVYADKVDKEAKSGIGWEPKDVSLKTWVTDYSKKLRKSKNSFFLTIWPDHCLIGTVGHSMQTDIQRALMEWNRHKNHCNKTIKYITKGMNCLTEVKSTVLLRSN